MRLFTIILVLAFVAVGVSFGALNADLVGYDFGVFRVDLPKGAALIAALLIGWLLGGITAWAGSHRKRTRRHSLKTAGPDDA